MAAMSFDIHAGMWGKDIPSGVINYDFRDLYFEKQGDPSVGFNFDTGGSIYARASANLGLAYTVGFGLIGNLTLHAGSIDADYTFDPNEVISQASDYNQNPYIDTSDFAIDGGQLSTTGLDLEKSSIDVDLAAKLKATLHGGYSVSAGVDLGILGSGSIGDSGGFSTELLNFDRRIDLLSLNGGEIEPATFDFTYGQVTAQLPSQINTSTSDIDTSNNKYGSFSTSGTSNPILSATFDVDAAILATFGLPPNLLTGNLNLINLGFARAGINYTLLDADLVGNASLRQDFSFTPDINVNMETSLGEIITGKLGDKFTFDTPEGEGDFTVTATYSLKGAITSKTGVFLSSSFDYELLRAQLAAQVGVSVLGRNIGAEWTSNPVVLADGSLGIGGGALIPLFEDTSEYEAGPVTKTYTLHYENFYKGSDKDDTFTLTTHQETANGQAGNDTIKGNALDNELLGAEGNDILSGNGGNDKIFGGDGLDTALFNGEWADYSVTRNLSGEFVFTDRRAGADGQDTILDVEVFQFADQTLNWTQVLTPRTTYSTSKDFVLPDDALSLTATGSDNTTLTGNNLNNTISGNAGNNMIFADGGRDKVNGGSGNDTLNGGLGNDDLTGGRGRDAFVFDSKPNKKSNRDKVVDFNPKDDSILLDNAIFKKLGKGSADKPIKIKKDFFALDSAKDKNDYIIYNTKTGVLSYDADGSGGRSGIEFAVLKKNLKVTYHDFFVV